MDFDNSWDALLKPGEATVYFDGLNDKPFQVDATDYSKINAWWLAEFSRLIYRQEADEIGKAFTGPTRKEILKEVGFEEVQFFNQAERGKGDTQCAIFKTKAGAATPFAVLAFRGTLNLVNWLTNIKAIPDPWPRGGKVHEGFKAALELVWADVNAVLEPLKQINCPVFYTGHSLGAALATLAASLRPPQALYTFGSPLTGNKDFAKSLSGVEVYRVVNNRDAVTIVPPLGFHHLGKLYYITHNGEMEINPGRLGIFLDRLKGNPVSLFSPGWHEHLTDPPEYLADHAPVNYVAHLERLFP